MNEGVATRALSMLTRFRHGVGIRWGSFGMPYENEVDEVIGQLERASKEAEAGGMDCTCGLPMSKNPHPDAGDPERLLAVGATYVCAPCTVRSLHSTRRFYEARMNELQRYQECLPEPHRTAVCNILANGTADILPQAEVQSP